MGAIIKAIAELSVPIVEDHPPLQQKRLVEQLHRWGCRAVAVAGDGVEALEVCAYNKPPTASTVLQMLKNALPLNIAG